MLPFGRMFVYGNEAPVVDPSVLLDVNFALQEEGSTIIKDHSMYNRIFSLYRGSGGSVVYDDEFGSNVMDMGTGSCYRTPSTGANSDLSLVDMDFEITLTYKSTNATAYQSLLETGNYNQTTRSGGFTCLLNQTPTKYLQFFMDNLSVFRRVEMNGTNPLVWETVVFTYIRGTGCKVYRKLTDSTEDFPGLAFAFSAGGGYLSIGGDYVHSNIAFAQFFNGRISGIKIRKLND